MFSDKDIIRLCAKLVLLVYLSSMAAASRKHSHSNCVRNGITFTCDFDLSDAIPHGVSEIYITDYNHNSVKRLFDNNSEWRSVQKLDIKINSAFKLEDNSFSPLYNLLYLGIHAIWLEEIAADAFKGLDNVKHLDLSECTRLSPTELVRSIISNETMPSLLELNLKQLFTRMGGNTFSFDNDFMEMLHRRKIQWLCLSGTNILFHNYDKFFDKTLSSLEYIDTSDMTIVIIPRSEKLSVYTASQMLVNTTFRNIKYLNMSKVLPRYVTIDSHLENTYVNADKYTLFNLPHLESIDLSYTVNTKLYMNNITFDMSRIPGRWKSFIFRGNHFRICNGTFFWPKQSRIKLLDLSLNGMEYVSINFFSKLDTVEELIMSNNSLYKMEPLEEFKDIFKFLHLLKYLDLSHNALTFIPEQMFVNNQKLIRLNLNGNKLNTISFTFSHLYMLDDLDIRNNRIQNIERPFLKTLMTNFELQRVKTDNLFKFQIDGNPFVCSCKSVNFIKWLAQRVKLVTKKDNRCNFEGKQIYIDGKAIGKSEFDCIRTTIITVIFVSSAFIACLISIIFVVIIRKTKREKHAHYIHHFVDNFQRKRLDEKYLIFLSYSSNDGDLVLDHIHTTLVNFMKDTFGVQDDVVCHGEGYFRPGFPIINESMGCISKSCVIIFVVSRSFCLSDWCRMELKEAYEQDKPIVLIFIEQVDKRIMPLYLLNIFEKQTRVKLVHVEGAYKLIPNWTLLCKCVIELASLKHQEKEEDRKRLHHYIQVPCNDPQV